MRRNTFTEKSFPAFFALFPLLLNRRTLPTHASDDSTCLNKLFRVFLGLFFISALLLGVGKKKWRMLDSLLFCFFSGENKEKKNLNFNRAICCRPSKIKRSRANQRERMIFFSQKFLRRNSQIIETAVFCARANNYKKHCKDFPKSFN